MGWLLSLLHVALIYALMGVMGIIGLPLVLWSRDQTYNWMRLYCRGTFFLSRLLVGIRVEIRGTPPTEPVVIASKHQSLLDVLMIYASVPRAKFVMKKSLLWVPIFGLYTWRIGSVAIDRGARGQGGKVLNELDRQRHEDGQIVIYPQGTRVPPGESALYRRGAAMVYERAGLPMVLAATNTGWLWPKKGIRRRPGTAVVEFLETLPPGMNSRAVMSLMETRIEAESERLGRETLLGQQASVQTLRPDI